MTIAGDMEPNLSKLSEENAKNFANKEKDDKKKWVTLQTSFTFKTIK